MALEKTRTINTLDNIILSSLYVIAFFLPISKGIIEVFSTLAILCYILKRIIQRESFPKTIVKLPILAYLAVCFISIFISSNPNISARTFIGKTLQEVLFFFVVAETLNNKQRMKNFIEILLASSFLMCIDGIYQHFTHKDFIRHRPYFQLPRVHATFSSANDFGAYLAAIVPFTIVWFFNKEDSKKSARFLSAGLFALLITCLLLTVSRGGWFAAIIAMLFMSIWIRSLAIFFLVISIFIILTQQFYFPLLQRRLDKLFIFVDQSSLDRMRIWEAAWRMFTYRPLLGLGLGTFMFNFEKFVVGKYAQGIIPYTHNCYLQIASELGIIGLVSFLAILLCFFSYGIETLIYREKTFSWYILLASLASLLGYCLQMSVDTIFYSLDLGILFWIMLGLGVAATNSLSKEAVTPQN